MNALPSKYALIIGINYTKLDDHKLSGCTNDARSLYKRLVLNKGFAVDNIRLLVDDDPALPAQFPSPENVGAALKWLVTDRKAGDVIFFSYSGHGTRVQSSDLGETDSMDEVLLLEGDNTLYFMLDDDVKRYFSVLPEGTVATAVFDCCHSHTAADSRNDRISGRDEHSTAVSTSRNLNVKSTRSRLLPAHVAAAKISEDLGVQIDVGRFGEAMMLAHGPLSGSLAFRYFVDTLKEGLKMQLSHSLVEELLRDGESRRSIWQSVLGGFVENLWWVEGFSTSELAAKTAAALFEAGHHPFVAHAGRHFVGKSTQFWTEFANALRKAINSAPDTAPVSRAPALGAAAAQELVSEIDTIEEARAAGELALPHFWDDFGRAFRAANALDGLRRVSGFERAIKLGRLYGASVRARRDFDTVAAVAAGLTESPLSFWSNFGSGFADSSLGIVQATATEVDQHPQLPVALAKALASTLLSGPAEGARDVSQRNVKSLWAADFMPSVAVSNTRDVAIVMTACLQDELSQEMTEYSKDTHGLFTMKLLDCMDEKSGISNYDLVNTIRAKISEQGISTQHATLACSVDQQDLPFICQDSAQSADARTQQVAKSL